MILVANQHNMSSLAGYKKIYAPKSTFIEDFGDSDFLVTVNF
jgi:hypothetical protein